LRWTIPTLALISVAASACGNNAPPKSPRERSVVARKSTAAQRKSIAVTVYNSDFALVREVRDIELANGRVELQLADVAARIEPETVSVRSLEGAQALSVVEQNYRYDLLTPTTLLEKYVGKSIKVYRYNEELGKDDVFDAQVLSTEQEPVLKIGDEITFGLRGRYSFPNVPPNLIAKPTLVWLLDSDRPRQRVEIGYMTRRMSWHADYVVLLNADDSKADLTGWVTLANESGATFENADLKLVAGNVQRVTPQQHAYADDLAAAPMTKAAEMPRREFKEEGFFEYHLYSLNEPATLLDREQKQLTLLSGEGVGVQKRLMFYGASHYYRASYGQVVSNQKVGVYLDIENKKENHLGMPLPQGTMRVYKADASGSLQFVGEDAIEHTPRDESVKIKLGEAFDVVGDRRETEFKERGGCAAESGWEISLRNHKDAPVTVIVTEPVGGDWEILTSSLPYKKKDASTITFDVPVPARGETKLTYRIRVRWC
jgi:hypothetical protein